MKPNKTSLVAALAAISGLAAPSPTTLAGNALPNASIIASSVAAHNNQKMARHLPFFNLLKPKNPWKGKLFNHFHLSQRQRRKFNRQRHAAGFKNAFA